MVEYKRFNPQKPLSKLDKTCTTLVQRCTTLYNGGYFGLENGGGNSRIFNRKLQPGQGSGKGHLVPAKKTRKRTQKKEGGGRLPFNGK